MEEVELVFMREDLFPNEPDRKVIIGQFNIPPVAGDYLIISKEMKINSWAKEYDEEFMEKIMGETYKVTERIYTGAVILCNLKKFDTSDSIGGFISRLGTLKK